MKIYFAPMEGVTGFVYRKAHREIYTGVDKYYAPFVSPNQHCSFKTKEKLDIDPANNKGCVMVPQVLTNKADEFIWAAAVMEQLGYSEVNLNLGCPSGTVSAKGKGAGFLAKTEELDRFLETCFDGCRINLSIKTRLGMEKPEEIFRLMEIYNKYPVSELTIHPRVREEFYRGEPHRDIFREALAMAKMPVCYNGNLFTVQDIREFEKEFPTVESVMIGRGLIANPELAEAYRAERTEAPDKARLKRLHDQVLEHYLSQVSGAHNTIYKMKELWFYMICLFPEAKKFEKKIRKSQRLEEYRATVDEMFAVLDPTPGVGFTGSDRGGLG